MRSLAKKVSRKFDDRVELYVQTGIFLRESDPDIAKSYFDKALSKIDKIEDSSESIRNKFTIRIKKMIKECDRKKH